MSKRKVLFITPSLCQGGIEHSLITMLKLLDKTKYDLTLFTYLDDMTLLPLVPQEVRVVTDENKPHYYRKPKAVFYSALKSVAQKLKMKKFSEKIAEKQRVYIHQQKVKHPARDIFKNEQFDVVVSYAVGICTEMALYFNSRHYYVFFHSSLDLHHELLEKLFPKYTSIVAVSEAVREMLINNYSNSADKITVLKNYVDANRILEMSKESINIKSDNYKFCTCGRLSSEKGFDIAVEAASILKENRIDFIWYFVGDGDLRGTVEELIRDYEICENIIITGYVNNPYPYIKNCDIYIQPSYEEAQPLAVLEAMILGKAVVSTRTVGGKYILENGEKGVLTDINGRAIAEGILSLVNDVDLKRSFENLYTIQENIKEKEIYINKIDELLSQ